MEGFDDFMDGSGADSTLGQPSSGAYDAFAAPVTPAESLATPEPQAPELLADTFSSSLAPADSFAAPAAPAAPAGPERVDARIEWRARNAEVLKKRDADELEANKKVQAEAQDYLKSFYEKRASHVERAKKENRDVEEAAKLKPTGDTAWERVISLIDFKFDSGRQKEVDRDRLKNLLFTAKERNVPVRGPVAQAAA